MRTTVLLALILIAISVSGLVAGTRSEWERERLLFRDDVTGEVILPVAQVVFHEEFLGAYFQKYTANEDTHALWKTVETNLNAAIELSADAVPGVLSIALDADDNDERGVVYWGDNEALSIDDGLVFEARVKFSVAQTGYTTLVIGLAGADNADADSIDTHAWFRVHNAAATALLWETDDGTTDDNDNAAATIGATAWVLLRIDAFEKTAVKFYVDNLLVGTGAMSALTSTTGKVQPYIAVQKSAGTGVGTLLVDKITCYAGR